MKNIFFSFLLTLSLQAQIPEGKKVISNLYLYNIETGLSKLILKEKRHFEAPNWIVNEKASPYGIRSGVPMAERSSRVKVNRSVLV